MGLNAEMPQLALSAELLICLKNKVVFIAVITIDMIRLRLMIYELYRILRTDPIIVSSCKRSTL